MTQDLSFFEDVLSQKHVLIAGASGSGKSVTENGIVYTASLSLPFDVPGGKQLILIDPKIEDMAFFADLPHVIKYVDGDEGFEEALETAVEIMKSRQESNKNAHRRGGYPGSDIYVIIEECQLLTGALDAKRRKKYLGLINTLVTTGRSAKIHVIICTQTPQASVIPTVIKNNIEAKIALATGSKEDPTAVQYSKYLCGDARCCDLDVGEALYKADGFKSRWTKINVPMISDSEIDAVVDCWKNHRVPHVMRSSVSA